MVLQEAYPADQTFEKPVWNTKEPADPSHGWHTTACRKSPRVPNSTCRQNGTRVCLASNFFGRCAICAVPRTILRAMMPRMMLSLLIPKVAPPNLRSLHSRVWIPPQKGPRRFQLVVAWLQRQLLLLRCHPLLRRQCFQLLAPLKVRLWRPLLRPGSQRRIVQPLLVRGWKIPNFQLAMTLSPTPHFPTLSWEVGKIWKYLEGSLQMQIALLSFELFFLSGLVDPLEVLRGKSLCWRTGWRAKVEGLSHPLLLTRWQQCRWQTMMLKFFGYIWVS